MRAWRVFIESGPFGWGLALCLLMAIATLGHSPANDAYAQHEKWEALCRTATAQNFIQYHDATGWHETWTAYGAAQMQDWKRTMAGGYILCDDGEKVRQDGKRL